MRVWLLIVALAGCTARNPLYCENDHDCSTGICDLGTNSCTSTSGPDAALPIDAAPPADAASSIDAPPMDASFDAAAHVCSSTCSLCSQNNRACCGSTCCGFGEWCDTSGGTPTCRCGSGSPCGFNNYCCAAVGQCGSQCRSSCF